VRRLLLAVLALLPLAATAACDDATNPFDEVVIARDSALILRAPTSAVEGPSALDASAPPRVVSPELPGFAGAWDFSLRQSGSTFSLITARQVLVGAPRSALPLIAPSSQSFEAIEEASRNRSSYSDSAVALTPGGVYTYRTRLYSSRGGSCFNYGKLQVLALDPADGSARLLAAVNVRCGDERLVED
jgi:hypothetical protein